MDYYELTKEGRTALRRRNRTIYRMYQRGAMLTAIASEFDISRQRVSKIVDREIKKAVERRVKRRQRRGE